ncbi:MAG: cellulase family glycosylhydrolase [Solirubrobacteraceae bacterium]|nr:cellulase family glycosylhydrolase [Solirubrobacteraceae bacterium]
MPYLRRAASMMLACTALLILPAGAQAAGAPAGMFGFGDWGWPSTTTLDRESAQGVRTWRVPLDFRAIGATKGSYNFTGFDGLVLNAARRNVRILPVLTGCPAWACPSGGPANSATALPEWKAFVTAAVKRYGTGGSLWAANPTVSARPVLEWQVLNEVNGSDAWPNPSAAAYAQFLVATAPAIRAADPQAKVVLAGLPQKMTIWMQDYLPALYAQPGFKDAVDVIAIHGYAPTPGETLTTLDTARKIMVANGDSATPLWITEMGWSTGGPVHPFTVTEATQAANLRSSWTTMVGCRARWNLERVMWFGVRDITITTGMTDYWGYHKGMFRLDGTAKPSLAEADRLTSGADLGAAGSTCSLPGGTTIDTTPPETTLASTPGARTQSFTPAFQFASNEAGVTYECRYNANGFRPCPVDANGTWTASTLWQGAFTFDVRALDPSGNADPTPAHTSFIVDRQMPDTYVSGTWGNVAIGPVSLTLSASEPVLRYECRVDSGAWATCTSPFTTTMPAGSHTISVRATDLAGWVDTSPAVPWYQAR